MAEHLIYTALGALIAFPLIRLNIKVASSLGLIEWPKSRGVAQNQVPLVGISLVAFSLVVLVVITNIYNLSPWFLTTASVVAVMGYFDDKRPLTALDKIFFQFVCVSAMVFLDPEIRENVGSRFGVLGSLVSVFFIVGLVNAVNFIDGIDGLAGIVIAFGGFGYLVYGSRFADVAPYGIFTSMIMGMMFSFLYFNVIKRQGFLGNIGSYFFSYVLAVCHLSLPLNAPDITARLSFTALCFLVPVADCITVISSRIITFRSPFQGDKGHLHHRLVQTSLALKYVLLSFFMISGSSLLVGYALVRHSMVNLTFLPTAVCGCLVMISSILILMIEKTSKLRMQAYFKKLDSGEPIYFLRYKVRQLDGKALKPNQLRRLEAKISAEIRITDACFIEQPDMIFVTVKTLAEPLKGISARLDAIFQAEHLHPTLVIDQGEFVKVGYPKVGKKSA